MGYNYVFIHSIFQTPQRSSMYTYQLDFPTPRDATPDASIASMQGHIGPASFIIRDVKSHDITSYFEHQFLRPNATQHNSTQLNSSSFTPQTRKATRPSTPAATPNPTSFFPAPPVNVAGPLKLALALGELPLQLYVELPLTGATGTILVGTAVFAATRPTDTTGAGAAVSPAATGSGAGVCVMNWTCGTVICEVTIDASGLLSFVIVIVFTSCTVVFGTSTFPRPVGTRTGESVMVDGTLVQIPGFWGMKSAQTPAK